MRKALSIIAITLGYLGLATFAIVELARYYGWASYYNSASWLAIDRFYSSFGTSGSILTEVIILSAFAVVSVLAILTFRLVSEAKVRAASRIDVTLPVSMEAAYFGEAFKRETSKEATPDLEQQYNYLLNK